MHSSPGWIEAAVRRTFANIGVELEDVDGFTCCPDPISFQARDKIEWYTVAARNLSVAEDVGNDIITTCSGCTATLSEVNLALKEDKELRDTVNKRLSRIGREFKGTIDTSSGGIRTEFPCAVKKRNFCRFNGGSDAVRLSIDTSSGGVRLTSIN